MNLPNNYAKIFATVFCMVEVALTCSRTAGADASLYSVYKRVQYSQTNSGAPTLLQSYPYIAYSSVYLTASNSATSATLTEPTAVTVPMSLDYLINTLPPRWAFAEGDDFASQAEMDAAWPNGNYTISIYTAHDGFK